MLRHISNILVVIIFVLFSVFPAYAVNGNFYDTISQASDNNDGINTDESSYDYSVLNNENNSNEVLSNNNDSNSNRINLEEVKLQDGDTDDGTNNNEETDDPVDEINQICQDIIRILSGQFGVSVSNTVIGVRIVSFGGDNPGGDNPGGDNPGGDNPGGDNPGGDNPGGDNPGGDNPGGDNPGGDNPGGDNPGGDNPGGDNPGGDNPGGDNPGGDNPGGDNPGGDNPGGDNPGGDNPGGDNPGGDNPGGDNPGGDNPGGDNPGGDNPGGDNPGGDNPGGDNPGGDNPGGDNPGGDNPGGDNPGGDNPGGDNPGGDNPGGDNPGGDNPGGDNPGGDNPGGDNPSFSNDAEEIAYYKNKIQNELNINILEDDATWDAYNIKQTYIVLSQMPEFYRSLVFSITRENQSHGSNNMLAYVMSPNIQHTEAEVRAGQKNDFRKMHLLDLAVSSQPTEEEKNSKKIELWFDLLDDFKENFAIANGREPNNSEISELRDSQETKDYLEQAANDYFQARTNYYLARTLAHEIGHCLRNTYYNYIKSWQSQFWNGDTPKNANDIPSDYGKSSVDEDFAECLSYFIIGTMNETGEINFDGSYTYDCPYEGEHTISKERFEFIANMIAEVENTYKQNGNSHPWNGRD